jgi:Putative Actinobacterial Holin-X, holin superfamily III
MPTPDTDSPTMGLVAKQVAERASSIARLEVELASLEVKKKLALLGAGIGLLAAAAAVLLYGIGFLFATIAAGLATFLPFWLSLLIVTLLLFLVGGVLALLGVRRVQRGKTPVPKQAIAEAKLTTQALKGDGST